MKQFQHINLFLILLLSIPSLLFAKDSTSCVWDGIGQSTNYSKPFLSEMHSTMCKAEVGYNKSYSEFDLLETKSKFSRPMAELHVGFDAPIYAYGYGTPGCYQKWGVGISFPLSVHVLEDLWGPETAPVINTDYRFGAPKLKAIYHVSDYNFIKNISLSWLPIFHECTHLGDEIIIYRIDENFPITRINVSYEYTEMQLTINDPIERDENYNSFRFGFAYRISNRGLGWYSVREDIEANKDIELKPSTHRSEYYIEYQAQRAKGFLASKRFVNVISMEVRNRLRYGYPLFVKDANGAWTSKAVNEQMELCYNLYAGYKFYPRVKQDQSLGLFLHAYRGLNPYGQLRNYPSYPFFGISITYER